MGFRILIPFFFERTRPATSMRVPCLIYLSLLITQGREREATDADVCLQDSKASSYRGAYWVPLPNYYVGVIEILRFY